MAMLSSTILQAALFFYVVISAHADEPTVYKICKNENEDCVAVTYNLGDPSKERVCREACGMTGEELNTKWTVYNCKGHEKTCEAYDLGAKGDFDTSFARHVACVGTCGFLEKAQYDTTGNLKLCSAENSSCMTVPRLKGNFDAYRMCAFRCGGFWDLAQTERQYSLLCTENNTCQEGSYFTEPNVPRPFVRLSECLEMCLTPDGAGPVVTGDSGSKCLIMGGV